MTSVADYVSKISADLERAEVFFGHGTDNALDEAVYLVFASLGLDYTDDSAAERLLTAEEVALLNTRLQQRIEGREPVAYLVGEAWFAGRRFLADSRALVPRSPLAELLVDRTLPFVDTEPQRILDLCCGGGCIGIAAALEFESAHVEMADLSEGALALARENIALHKVGGRVTLCQSDLFEELVGPYDLILSNPPYVPEDEALDMPSEYRHEPEMGLVSADEGLEIPLRILRGAAQFLSERGVLVLEVGFSHVQLSERLAGIPLVWLDFERGGEGVLAITRDDLMRYRGQFN